MNSHFQLLTIAFTPCVQANQLMANAIQNIDSKINHKLAKIDKLTTSLHALKS
jgi:hypothetical protein